MLGLVSMACGGPRSLRLDPTLYPRRPRIYPIEIYDGEVDQPHREIEIIESSASTGDDDRTRVEQVEELRRHARRVGADALENIRILVKEVKGYSFDERTPFPAWKQGEFPLYFMRATAIIYESSLPGSVAEGRGFTLPAETETP